MYTTITKAYNLENPLQKSPPPNIKFIVLLATQKGLQYNCKLEPLQDIIPTYQYESIFREHDNIYKTKL